MNIMRKNQITKTIAALMLAAAVVCLCACGSEVEQSTVESVATTAATTATTATTTTATTIATTTATTATTAEPEPPEPISEWDSATIRWRANTALSFELRVKAGFEYDLSPDSNNQGCTFTLPDGKTIYIVVQGFNYEASFESLVAYFDGKDPERLSVGKESMTIVTEYDSYNTEIVSKLSDIECLTTLVSDVETADEFFSSVMIRVDGEDYSPLDLDEDFYEVK